MMTKWEGAQLWYLPKSLDFKQISLMNVSSATVGESFNNQLPHQSQRKILGQPLRAVEANRQNLNLNHNINHNHNRNNNSLSNRNNKSGNLSLASQNNNNYQSLNHSNNKKSRRKHRSLSQMNHNKSNPSLEILLIKSRRKILTPLLRLQIRMQRMLLLNPRLFKIISQSSQILNQVEPLTSPE